jgi:16S rRNA A1518/A1519 N6-dimethyltransferase RsmA/KsgA/DIM1 with predicted DNA glycosylase/AP lyase activity
MLTRALTPHGKFYGWDNDFVSRSILKGEFWEVYFKPWLDVVPVEKSVVDVGAHIGFFTVYLGLKGHDVYAFEPNKCFRKDLTSLNFNSSSANINIFGDEFDNIFLNNLLKSNFFDNVVVIRLLKWLLN